MTAYKVKRIYEQPDNDDGYRVLVDHLWPRGVSKEAAQLGEWCKEVAPSTELRVWYGHKPVRFDEFRKRYVAELAKNAAAGELLEQVKDKGVATLLYGAHDTHLNQAVVLQDFLQNSLAKNKASAIM